jgi:hypothetical protein
MRAEPSPGVAKQSNVSIVRVYTTGGAEWHVSKLPPTPERDKNGAIANTSESVSST